MRRAILALPLLLGFAACGGPNDPLATALYQGAATVPQASGPAAYRGPARNCDTAFRVVNHSGLTVEQLYFSHASAGSWGRDQLGQGVLPPGRSASYRAARPGAYDFRVIFANGRTAELRGVNICAASGIVVTNGGLHAT